jgi:flavin-dependent dehydrogenase
MARCAARVRLPHLNREITIAGGGLAGLSLGIALRGRDIPVTVLEAGSYPRHRVCGEFISGVEKSTLSRLGIQPLFSDVRRHETLVWHEKGKVIHRNRLPECAIGISRHELDERLRLHFESLGGILKTGTRAKPEPADGFVWAAGRRPRTGQWIGLKAHVRGLPMAADLEMHAGSNGYSGLAGVEDGWTNVCGLFRIDRTLDAKGPELLTAYIDSGGSTDLADQLRAAEWRAGSFSAVAGFELGKQPEVPGLLCLGDAESMIPPFTGNGMSMAFQAADVAVDPLASWSHGGNCWESTRHIISTDLRKLFRRRLSTALFLHRVLLSDRGRTLLQTLSAARLLPFRPVLSLVR